MTQQLALGTAQFGLDYGITNARGRVPGTEVAALLEQAWSGGVRVLDTARAYGSSEEALGETMQHEWRVVTKTAPLRAQAIDALSIAHVEAGFRESLRHLRRESVDSLLVHHASDLLAPDGERLYNWLLACRDEGLTRRIGVSVYDADEIVAVMARFPVDVMQLPASIADQRLVVDGSVARLHAAGVELHVRSLFLQGVLLAPDFGAGRFPQQAAWLRDFHQECTRCGVSAQHACLGFFKSHPEFTVAVAGVSTGEELSALLTAWQEAPAMDWRGWGVDNTAFTDPRLWKAHS